MTMSKPKSLPPLHQQALRYKNFKRLQHDGGRAWIKDSQLAPTIREAHLGLQTQHKSDKSITAGE
jgi:hypothetical protein